LLRGVKSLDATFARPCPRAPAKAPRRPSSPRWGHATSPHLCSGEDSGYAILARQCTESSEC